MVHAEGVHKRDPHEHQLCCAIHLTGFQTGILYMYKVYVCLRLCLERFEMIKKSNWLLSCIKGLYMPPICDRGKGE